VILERSLAGLTVFFLLEATELQRVVLSRGADVVGNKQVVSDLVAFLGMVPEPTYIFDAGAVMIEEGIIDRDGAIVDPENWTTS